MDLRILSAYTTLSGRPAHPGALLWKEEDLNIFSLSFISHTSGWQLLCFIFALC